MSEITELYPKFKKFEHQLDGLVSHQKDYIKDLISHIYPDGSEVCKDKVEECSTQIYAIDKILQLLFEHLFGLFKSKKHWALELDHNRKMVIEANRRKDKNRKEFGFACSIGISKY